MAKKYKKKGFYKKGKKALKKSNIFSKKSAKSQAYQIYQLNKKVNRIQKIYRPEIKSEILINQHRYLDFSAFGDTKKDNVYYQSAIINDWRYFKATSSAQPEVGQYEKFEFNGSMIRFKNILLRMWFRMNSGANAEQYYYQSEEPINPDYTVMKINKTPVSEQDYVYIRIIIAQLKNTIQNSQDTTSILNDYSIGNQEDRMVYRMKGPYRKGTYKNYRVLRDKTIKMQYWNTQGRFVTFNLKRLRNYQKLQQVQGGDSIGSGDIIVAISAWAPNRGFSKYQLEKTGQPTLSDGLPNVHMNMQASIYYIDEGVNKNQSLHDGDDN